ncbi:MULTISPECIES: tRNA uridine-5-carboxymethylaminomethyl(34) synthesis GTPase MnmE [Gemmobacter]|uniref:tRNA modification GTPase MnmE n=1 Tax=Gemmobacter caeni TaxID=589035 RepID=A0A2T6AQR0_9RHOB|nr:MULTISPECIES: tRNA uridine-5-carboxymethylaminomethyl(34) synthesis GTPase MnmE [Gemmobacter]OJY33020.1 MAG: tRNA uridine-5-carboxymethylaminomethyl(34) synthesis GTPase MnmE [Rhodobacterales bacterium 65-51]PTX46165.1 tRNA modification GTPase trmE [Gemmobacter caeni]TWI94470.1 tRNA modification GTPase trmE [Gemmobacter caeni]
MDTIYALASARGRAGVAIIRVSGPAAFEAARKLTRGALPPERQAVLRKIELDGEILDEGLLLLFGAERSFTGEAVAEFHLHGSIAVTGAVLRAMSTIPGLRPAGPGEFTRRALENGRLDLAQVEALADLIDAETEAQRRQAVRVLSGHIGQRVEAWRGRLLRAAALIEATIDFVDEDVPVDVTPEVREIATALLDEMQKEISASAVAERVRQGFEVAIVGAPNAGKSTLLNALAGREAAITSEVAGTTRDVIEVRMDIAGFPVTLLDTAGLRETDDHVEGIGIARAIERAGQADLRIFLLENRADVLPMTPEEGDIILLGKADLWEDANILSVSGKTGQGLDRLVERIGQQLSGRYDGEPLLIRERQRLALMDAAASLKVALAWLSSYDSRVELVAESLRAASRSLDMLIGRIGVEDILGEIFSSFCIGK